MIVAGSDGDRIWHPFQGSHPMVWLALSLLINSPDDGRVEICLDGFWRSVCGDGWDYRDADVVCRQLEYDGCEPQYLFDFSAI